MRAEELYGEGGYTYLGNGDFQAHPSGHVGQGYQGGHVGNMPSELTARPHVVTGQNLTLGDSCATSWTAAAVLRLHSGIDKGGSKSSPVSESRRTEGEEK